MEASDHDHLLVDEPLEKGVWKSNEHCATSVSMHDGIEFWHLSYGIQRAVDMQDIKETWSFIRADELRRVAPVLDPGNLGGGEADDLIPLVLPEVGIEIVEVPSGRPQDEDKTRRWLHAH